jgi:hypothetical protein
MLWLQKKLPKNSAAVVNRVGKCRLKHVRISLPFRIKAYVHVQFVSAH